MTHNLVLPDTNLFLAEGVKSARGGQREPQESLADFNRRIQQFDGVQRISGNGARLIALTVRKANTTLGEYVEAQEAMAELALDAGAYREAVQELDALELVTAYANMNHPSGYSRAIAKPSTCVQVVGQILPDVDVRRELGRLLLVFPKSPDEMIASAPFLALGIPAPRVQWLMEFLRDEGLVRIWEGDGRPLWFFRAQLLVKGRLALRGP